MPKQVCIKLNSKFLESLNINKECIKEMISDLYTIFVFKENYNVKK